MDDAIGIVILNDNEVGTFAIDENERMTFAFNMGAAGIRESLEFASDQGMIFALQLKPEYGIE